MIKKIIDNLNYIVAFLEGKKTYLVCVATIAYAITGFYIKQLDSVTMVNMIFASLGVAGVRNSITSQMNRIITNLLQTGEVVELPEQPTKEITNK